MRGQRTPPGRISHARSRLPVDNSPTNTGNFGRLRRQRRSSAATTPRPTMRRHPRATPKEGMKLHPRATPKEGMRRRQPLAMPQEAMRPPTPTGRLQPRRPPTPRAGRQLGWTPIQRPIRMNQASHLHATLAALMPAPAVVIRARQSGRASAPAAPRAAQGCNHAPAILALQQGVTAHGARVALHVSMFVRAMRLGAPPAPRMTAAHYGVGASGSVCDGGRRVG